MPANSSERAQALFAAALERAETEREAFLATECAGDAILADRVRRLLAADSSVEGTTVRPLVADLSGLLAGVSAADSRSGTRVGAYELREELGRGGMGVVFRAARVDGKIQHEVAIKIVQRALLDDNGLRRFQLERDIVAGFQHPYIARLYDVGELADGSPYLVMELIEGRTITDYCDAKQLSVRQRLALFLHVCEAVQHAHARLVLHRDIKPANVLVTEEGIPKLIDFGIAKPMTLGAEAERTGTRQRFFSPTNAAPEQISGGSAGVACDVYQLGTLLYELFCGATLFDTGGLTPGRLEERILAHAPDAPSARAARAGDAVAQARGAATATALAKQLQGDLDNIDLQALRKAPEERYASVEQFADDIRRYLEDQPVAARRGQRWYRARKFVRRHRVAVASVGLVFALIGAFLVTLLLQAQRLAAERDRADQVAQFLVDVFKSADPEASLTRDTPIGKVLDNARRQFDTQLTNTPELRAALLGTLADVYLNIDGYKIAGELAEEADQLLLQTAPHDRRLRIESLLRRAKAKLAAGDAQGSLAHVQEALGLHKELGDPIDRSWRTRLLHFEASQEIEGDFKPYAQATALWDDMVRGMGSDNSDAAKVELRISEILDSGLNPSPEAESRARHALGILKAKFPPNHPDVILATMLLGRAIEHQGRYEEGIGLLNEAYDGYVALLGPDSIAAALTKLRIGVAYSGQKNYPLAFEHYKQALATYQRIHGSQPHADLAAANYNIGELLYTGMLDLEAAEPYLRDAHSIAEKVWGPKQPNTLTFAGTLGLLLLERGQIAAAEEMLRKSVDGFGGPSKGPARQVIALATIHAGRGETTEALTLLNALEARLDRKKESHQEYFAAIDKLRAEISVAAK